MKNDLTVIVVSMLLISITAGILSVEEATANFGPTPADPPIITIVEPAELSIQSKNVVIVFNVTHLNTWWKAGIEIQYGYILDNQKPGTTQPILVSSETINNTVKRQWKFFLTGISDGPHKIRITGKIRETIIEYGYTDVGGAEGFSSPVNFIVDSIIPKISVVSPENRTYNNINLQFEWITDEETPISWYQLDNQTNATTNRNSTLIGLSEGSHRLVVYANDTAGNVGKSNLVYFTVDTTPLIITNLSIENKTYSSTEIPLGFIVNEQASWIGYSLNNQANRTIVGNTTLAGLSEDSHSIVIYANDTAGNIGKSDTIFFTVDTATPKPSPTHSPTQQPTSFAPQLDGLQPNLTMYSIFVGIIVLVIIIATGAVVYFKRGRG